MISGERLLNEVAGCKELLASLPDVAEWRVVGSAAVVGGGRDVDVLVLVREQGPFCGLLQDLGATFCSTNQYLNDSFTAMRRGNINFLVVDTRVEYDKWVIATEVCKWLSVKYMSCDRDTRVCIHRAIVDGLAPPQ